MKKTAVIVLVIAIVVITLLVKKTDKNLTQEPLPRNEVQQDNSYTEDYSLQDGTYSFQTNSTIEWSATGVGKSHTGAIALESGEVVVDDNVPQGALVFDMSTITSDAGDMLNKHLKSDDFFAVETYPTATFDIESYSNNSLVGNLTILEVTQPVIVPVSLDTNDGKLRINGDMSIDRTLWGIEYRSQSIFADIGDKAINDTIDFKINLTSQ